MNRAELIRIILWQCATVVACSVLTGVAFSMEAGLSVALGGFAVAIPNGLFGLYLLLGLYFRVQVKVATVLVGEIFKMLATGILFIFVAKLFAGLLVWPAMIFGIIAAVFSYFALGFVQH